MADTLNPGQWDIKVQQLVDTFMLFGIGSVTILSMRRHTGDFTAGCRVVFGAQTSGQ